MKNKPRLQVKYETEIVPAMMEKFSLKNSFQVPKIKKVSINMGIGKGAQEKKFIDDALSELSLIAGQKPFATRAKKAISNFKIREGSTVGCAVTLRKAYMYEFLDRLINVALPRIKDFRGVSIKSFDQAGNYSLGLKEHTIFPELNLDRISDVKGMTVTITITKTTQEVSREFMKMLGMPFEKR
ncbi:MAG: 50S ribosomal protein L5 [Candidatus Omnitrophota bacterium]